MITFELAGLDVPQAHGLLLSAVAPRPIALVSSLDAEGRPNLAPFSYFNVFSTRPPILIVGPNRSGRTGEQKDTVLNTQEVAEVVINVVTHDLVQQMNLAGAEIPRGSSEFELAGLTPIPSDRVRPFRVAESPVQIECRVREVLTLGEGPGAGNLVICEALLLHVNPRYLDATGRINQAALGLVGRLGGPYYSRTDSNCLFELPKAANTVLGLVGLPDYLRESKVLTGYDLGVLGHAERLPSLEEATKNLPTFAPEAFHSEADVHEYVYQQLRQPTAQPANHWLNLLIWAHHRFGTHV
jgi:flavin reductase (DIM6/NTAB) family NADH-FMN oxidoreductase RutF